MFNFLKSLCRANAGSVVASHLNVPLAALILFGASASQAAGSLETAILDRLARGEPATELIAQYRQSKAAKSTSQFRPESPSRAAATRGALERLQAELGKAGQGSALVVPFARELVADSSRRHQSFL